MPLWEANTVAIHQPVISVIVPVYNVEQFLPRCLDSIVEQTYRNLEIILVDDGSKDSSGAICDEYAAKDQRIRVFHDENRGVSAARNKGIDAAHGEYIAFVDSDDWIHPDFIRILTDMGQKHNADCVICGTETTDHQEPYRDCSKDTARVVAADMQGAMADHFRRTRVWGRIYRRTLIGKIRFLEGISLAEDAVFNLNVLCSEENIQVTAIDTKLYFYYERPGSAVRSLPTIQFAQALPYLQDIYAECNTTHRIHIAEHIIKHALLLRYTVWACSGSKEEQAKYNRLLRAYVKIGNGLPWKRYLLYKAFSLCPMLYRLFRISTDRSLLDWEAKQRDNRSGL